VATERQRRGAAAETAADAHLSAMGWSVLARNVRVGRDEIDLLAIDPGPPAELVFVEVRSATSHRFGQPEERVDRGKVAHLYRAMSALVGTDIVPAELRRLKRRIDLVVVDRRGGSPQIRHLRSLEPP